MKLTIYLTKNKVFYLDKSLDWDGLNLVKTFEVIKQEMGSGNLRIVLGNELGNVTFFGNEDGDRNKIGAEMQTWLPYKLGESCFDFRMGVYDSKKAAQVVAVEKWLLEAVSTAVRENGFGLELMVPVGALLAEKTLGKNHLVQVKWSGFENLSVLAINGFAYSVFGGETDERISEFVKTKWGANVSIEQMNLNAENYDLANEAFNEAVRGSDEQVLTIPLLKRQLSSSENLDLPQTLIYSTPEGEEIAKGKLSKTTIVLIVLLFLSLGVLIVAMWLRKKQPAVTAIPQEMAVALTVTPTVAVIPEVDVSQYKVNVLNGSGVTGEALRIKSLLAASGFLTVDVGNAPAQIDTEIKKKEVVVVDVVAKAKESFTDYKVGSIGTLTASDKYDLVIVLGSEKN